MYDLKHEVLETLKNDVGSAVINSFWELDSIDCSEGDGGVEGSVKKLTRTDAWVAIVVQCLMKRETRGGTVECFMLT